MPEDINAPPKKVDFRFDEWLFRFWAKYQIVQSITNVIAALGNGILAKTGTGSFAARTITGTTDRITVTNGDGVSGNPTVNISTAYVGQNSITTLGTISTGTWQGTTIGSAYGGTGFSTYTTGDIIYASAANTLAKLAAGTNGEVLTLVAGVPSWEPASSSGYPQHTLQANTLVQSFESYVVVGPLDLNGFSLTAYGRIKVS